MDSFQNLIARVGRARIKSQYKPSGIFEKDKKIITKMIEQTLALHNKNVNDMKVLKSFQDNNVDSTLNKSKENRPDINNAVTVPEAFRITRDLNSHICGSGVVFSDMTGEKTEQMNNLNKFLRSVLFNAQYLKANKNASIYGVGYYYLSPNNDFPNKKSPFLIETENLDPLNTYCVYSYDIIPKKIWAVNFYDVLDKNNKTIHKFTVWCEKYQVTLSQDDENKYIFEEPYALVYNTIPVIELQRNEDRIGDYELVLPLIKAKNLLFSNRIDDVQQVVDYVYLLYNLSLGVDEDDDSLTEEQKSKKKNEALTNVLQSRVIELKVESPTIQPKVDILKNPLNQTEIQTLANYIDSVINVMVALPDRNSNNGSASDTGVANDYKLGFRTLEGYSDVVTTYTISALTELLYCALEISKNSEYSSELNGLEANEIEIKPQRNKIFSITDSANAYSTLRSAGLNDEDAVKATNISPDIIETVKKNKAEAEEKRKMALEDMKNAKALEPTPKAEVKDNKPKPNKVEKTK